jgi:hypothetical protein
MLHLQAPGAGDWYVLIDGTNVNAVSTLLAASFAGTAAPAKQVSSGIYNLPLDLAKCGIPRS